jgi:hypothetical protein
MLPLIVSLMLLPTFNPSVLAPQITEAAPLSVSDFQNIALADAQEYNLTAAQTDMMMKVISCESGWVATSTGKLGERGLAQIYPKEHPEITQAQMLDPYFSLDFIAKNLYLHTSWWSCYALLTAGEPLVPR